MGDSSDLLPARRIDDPVTGSTQSNGNEGRRPVRAEHKRDSDISFDVDAFLADVLQPAAKQAAPKRASGAGQRGKADSSPAATFDPLGEPDVVTAGAAGSGERNRIHEAHHAFDLDDLAPPQDQPEDLMPAAENDDARLGADGDRDEGDEPNELDMLGESAADGDLLPTEEDDVSSSCYEAPELDVPEDRLPPALVIAVVGAESPGEGDADGHEVHVDIGVEEDEALAAAPPAAEATATERAGAAVRAPAAPLPLPVSAGALSHPWDDNGDEDVPVAAVMAGGTAAQPAARAAKSEEGELVPLVDDEHEVVVDEGDEPVADAASDSQAAAQPAPAPAPRDHASSQKAADRIRGPPPPAAAQARPAPVAQPPVRRALFDLAARGADALDLPWPSEPELGAEVSVGGGTGEADVAAEAGGDGDSAPAPSPEVFADAPGDTALPPILSDETFAEQAETGMADDPAMPPISVPVYAALLEPIAPAPAQQAPGGVNGGLAEEPGPAEAAPEDETHEPGAGIDLDGLDVAIVEEPVSVTAEVGAAVEAELAETQRSAAVLQHMVPEAVAQSAGLAKGRDIEVTEEASAADDLKAGELTETLEPYLPEGSDARDLGERERLDAAAGALRAALWREPYDPADLPSSDALVLGVARALVASGITVDCLVEFVLESEKSNKAQ